MAPAVGSSTAGAARVRCDRMPTLGPAERRVLLAALDVRVTAPMSSTGELDWATVIEVARAGKVLALLAHRAAIDHVALDGALHEQVREALHESAVYNTRLLAELAQCVRVLDHAGIEHVALKGAALMSRHYPMLALREVVDLDLLIDPAHFEAGLAALRAAGFGDADHTAAKTFDGHTYADALNAPHWHASAPLVGAGGVQIDLHRRMPTTAYEARGGFRGVHERSERIDVHGVSVRVGHPIDLALHACEHYALQNHGDPANAPRLMCDLRVLFPEQPRWSVLEQGPRGQRIAVAIAKRLYDAAFADAARIDPWTILLQRVAIGDPSIATWLAELSQLGGYLARFSADLIERPAFALRKVAPSRSYMAEHYGLDPRSPRIYPLYVKRLAQALIGSRRPGR